MEYNECEVFKILRMSKTDLHKNGAVIIKTHGLAAQTTHCSATKE